MIERLRFSLPISVDIDAPASVAWEALTDVSSYPSTFSGCLKVKPLGNQPSRAKTSSHEQAAAPPPRATRGSKWKITRISLVEKQTYSSEVTVTQFSDEADADGRRSLTMSTGQLLGATCSLKLVVEPVYRSAGVASEASSAKTNGEDGNAALTFPGRQDGLRKSDATQHTLDLDENEGSTSTKEGSDTNPPNNRTESCRVTAVLTMIPYRCFVKLLGIACCLCLLQSRARMAMECDLEDLADVCERRAKESGEEIGEEGQRRRRGDEGETGGSMSPGEVEAGGGAGEDDGREDRRIDLGTIAEEECSGC